MMWIPTVVPRQWLSSAMDISLTSFVFNGPKVFYDMDFKSSGTTPRAKGEENGSAPTSFVLPGSRIPDIIIWETESAKLNRLQPLPTLSSTRLRCVNSQYNCRGGGEQNPTPVFMCVQDQPVPRVPASSASIITPRLNKGLAQLYSASLFSSLLSAWY